MFFCSLDNNNSKLKKWEKYSYAHLVILSLKMTTRLQAFSKTEFWWLQVGLAWRGYLGWSGVNFTNMLMHSFYGSRSQKCKEESSHKLKKVDQLVELLYLSRFALYAVLSSLMKLTPETLIGMLFIRHTQIWT